MSVSSPTRSANWPVNASRSWRRAGGNPPLKARRRHRTRDVRDEAAFDDVFAVKTNGQFFTLVKTLLLLSDGASIIVTVGIGATRSLTGNSLTAGSREVLLTMIPSLALELAPRRIRVNAVSPGFTEPPMLKTTPGTGADEVAAMLAAVAAKTPFGRVGRPVDIAATASVPGAVGSGCGWHRPSSAGCGPGRRGESQESTGDPLTGHDGLQFTPRQHG